jgi:hypothetical protein
MCTAKDQSIGRCGIPAVTRQQCFDATPTRADDTLSVSATPGSGSAWANFCKLDTTNSAKAEAKELEYELFATPYAGSAVDYVGDRDYNADIITCNRKRDQKSGRIESEAPPGHIFPKDLPRCTIKGHYTYYSIVPLRYA